MCHCTLLEQPTELVHVTEFQTLVNPRLLNFHICLFDKREAHTTRRLLEHEEVVFTGNNLTLKFIDPIIYTPEVGELILRSEDFEYIVAVGEQRQLVLPFELLAYPATLSVIFINKKG